jgi:phosphate transport system substrate-binding protein
VEARPASWFLTITLLICVLVGQAAAQAQSAEPPHMARLPQNPPEWDADGRPLPAPLFWQPRLDDGLPAFASHYDKNLTGKITATSFNILPGLVDSWIKAFNSYYPNVEIENPQPYSGRGPKDLIDGKVDCAFVSRELKQSDITEFQATYGYPPTSIPVVGGSYDHYGFLDTIVFIVNKDNPIQELDYRQLDAVFSQTRLRGASGPVTTWGQLGLNGEWASKPVHVYGIQPWNGFEEFVRDRVLSVGEQRGEWRKDMNFVSDVVLPIPLWVGWDPYGIGYSGMAYVTQSTKPLEISEKATGPFYAPTYENVALAKYPLARVSYMNVNKKPGEALSPALAEFARFILSKQGQQLVLNEGIFLPLRSEQVTASLGELSK